MMLSPKAFRLVSSAVALLPDPRSRRVWGAWEEATAAPRNVSGQMLGIAIRAAQNMAHKIQDRLESQRLDDDAEVDSRNDLAYLNILLRDMTFEAAKDPELVSG